MREAFIRERTGALVGESLAQKWGWKVGDQVPIASNIFSQKNGSRTWDMKIVGIFSNRKPQADNNLLLFHYDYFDETRSFGKDTIGWLVLQTTSPDINDRVAKAIDRNFANSAYETATDTEKAFNKAFVAQLGNIALIVKLVVGAAFVTILMIVGNTMVMAVRERTREIGVLKTLGYSGARVLRLILGETVLLERVEHTTDLRIHEADARVVSLHALAAQIVGQLILVRLVAPQRRRGEIGLIFLHAADDRHLGLGIVTEVRIFRRDVRSVRSENADGQVERAVVLLRAAFENPRRVIGHDGVGVMPVGSRRGVPA